MHRYLSLIQIVNCVCALLVAELFTLPAHAAVTKRVSVSSEGVEADRAGEKPAISADGRYVVFYSKATNLVPGDTNEDGDVFLRDRRTGKTVRVSVASDGKEGKGQSRDQSISADGRYIAFSSSAPDLVPDDTNGRTDVFVHDVQTGNTTRVSVSSEGEQCDLASKYPAISADARYVAFYSKASNLVPGDTNQEGDVFVHDRRTGKTTRVSVASDGTPGAVQSDNPSISGDGRYVAFQSYAGNLVPGDTNERADIFVHDRETGKTVRVSVASDGTQGNEGSLSPSISRDGRYVVFQSYASNLVAGDTNRHCDIFLHDLNTGKTLRISVAGDGTQGDGESRQGFISADGRYVAFQSRSTNLVAGDTNGMKDVFLRDLKTGEITLVSVTSDGAQGNGDSSQAALSGDGRCVVFRSAASNLAAGDANGKSDIFVRDLEADEAAD